VEEGGGRRRGRAEGRAEGGGQKAEGRGQRAEGRGQSKISNLFLGLIVFPRGQTSLRDLSPSSAFSETSTIKKYTPARVDLFGHPSVRRRCWFVHLAASILLEGTEGASDETRKRNC
jgi:hypothetical protein